MELIRSPEFDAWLSGLRDVQGRLQAIRRLDRLGNGNPGDTRPVGGGVSELRIDVGPGYRVYYIRRSTTLIIVLAGGDKNSQARDIVSAKRIAHGGGTRVTPEWAAYDSADYLTDAELVRGYLTLVLEENDADELPRAFVTISRAAGLPAFADEIGIDPVRMRTGFGDLHAFDAPLMLLVIRAIGSRLTPVEAERAEAA